MKVKQNEAKYADSKRNLFKEEKNQEWIHCWWSLYKWQQWNFFRIEIVQKKLSTCASEKEFSMFDYKDILLCKSY